MAGVAVAVVAVSTSAILVDLSDAPSLVKACYRVLFMTGLVAPFAVRERDQFATISGSDWLLVTASGALLAGHFAAWFASIEYTSIAASTTLVQTQPAFVAVGAWLLLDERVTSRVAGGILVAISGSVLLSAGDFLGGTTVGSNPSLGNGLAVLGAASAAGYVLAGRSVRQRLSLGPYVLVVYGVCAATLFAAALALGLPLANYPAHEWGLFVAMAVGPGLLGHTVVNWALKYVESSIVSVSLLGEPVGSALLALAIFGEVPGEFTILGGAVILLGIAVTATDRAS
ncbi:DMT family transporter [Halobacterium litoreum]|uniref:DMT family transporter n=1 Tax=Halobacterium litoreum TaxID=2039234 RepID=A0ABD5NC95_9EURY|nr:DMT family transporter [Halobacterium litoreum]UHH14851.1 DMT family transporter [Halobacterium litoreum]